MAIQLPGMGFQALDDNGEVIANGTVTVDHYSDGTPAISYQDSSATIQNPYEVQLSSSGFANIYLAGGEYVIKMYNSDGTLERTIPKFKPFEGNNGGTNHGNKEEFTATASQANYTSSDVPIGTVSVHVNGLMLETTEYSVAGNVITFNPVLNSGDLVIYEYSSEALGGTSSGAGNIWSSTTNYGIGVIVSYNGIVYVSTSSSLNKQPDIEPIYWVISKGGTLWNATSNYVVGDIVSYGSKSYVAIATSINQQPDTATAYWKNLTLGMAWDSGKNYKEGDIVTEQKNAYFAKTDNINKQPSTNSLEWGEILGGTPWSSHPNYVPGQIVTKSQRIFVSILAGTNKDPLTQPTYWEELTPYGSLSSSGYVKLANGMILQWLLGTATVAGTVNTLPITFPNACLRAVGTDGGSTSSNSAISTDWLTTTSVKCFADITAPVTIFAIGY